MTCSQACAIESAAKWNPDKKVFVLFASARTSNGNHPKHVKALKEYKNIIFRNVNLWRYAKRTPLDSFMRADKLFTSNFVVAHMSDLLRFLT